MNITELKNLLGKYPAKRVVFLLPDMTTMPVHFHITEVGHVQKDYIDCGGTRRASSSCVLQAWVANDKDHALSTGKLVAILKLAGKVLPSDELQVEVEFEAPLISQFPVISADVTDDAVVFHLTTKRTDCLAKEKCGVESEFSCCPAESGCC
jgi:hypothetical protein